MNYQYSYNTAGRVTGQRFAIWGIPGKLDTSTPVNLDASYGWDTEGRMTSATHPLAGPQYSYTYDVNGR